MKAVSHRWLRSAASGRVAVALLVVLLSVVGFVVTKRAVDADRRAAADRQATSVAQQLSTLLTGRAGTFAVGLGSLLAAERVPNGGRFAALVGSATTTAGLDQAMWVESVTARGRRAYETRIGAPITRLIGGGPAPPAPSYLPATFTTGLPRPPFRPGVDVSGLPALATTLQNPASVFAGTATSEETVAGQRGFFVVQGAQFGRGPGSRGFLVVFAPAGWLGQYLNENPQLTAISLDGHGLAGALATTPAASQAFEALTQQWRVDVASEPASQNQAI